MAPVGCFITLLAAIETDGSLAAVTRPMSRMPCMRLAAAASRFPADCGGKASERGLAPRVGQPHQSGRNARRSGLDSRLVSDAVIRAERLSKTFRQGLWMRRVQAVNGVSFEVASGDIFGFLGPNGAGKTTTIKILTGLIAPTGGTASLFGQPLADRRVMRRVGFMPENPYVYPFLTPREFVELCGRLSGLGRRAVRDRAATVLGLVGILYAADRPVRKLSKGMLQRTALAGALVGDPELLILDEPMSGLDPVGRKEVKDLIVEEHNTGRTIFFSTHILSDVETLCDRVAILNRGEVVVSGKLAELLRSGAQRTDIVVLHAPPQFEERCTAAGHAVRRILDRLVVEVEGQAEVQAVIREAVSAGLSLAEVIPRSETLEDLFVREAIDAPSLVPKPRLDSARRASGDEARGEPAAED
jgi:ABC-2 type transport system ATP-binding protein